MSQPYRPLLALWAILLVLPLSISGEDEFGDSLSVSLVQVPVQVLLDGQPVRGLTQENFEIYEGRKKRKVIAFDVVDLALYEGQPGQPSEGAPVPLAGRRRFLFLFDLSNVEPPSLVRAREAALDLARNGLHASDLAAVATYRASWGARLILGFTSDRQQLELALTTLGSPELINRTADPLRLILGAAKSDLAAKMDSGNAGIGKRNSDIHIAIAAAALGEAQSELNRSRKLSEDEERERITNLSYSFGEMAKLLAQAQGRKYVVLLSEGFDSNVAFAATMDDASRDASEKGEIWDVDGDRTFGSTRVQNDLQNMIRDFQRADCVIEAIDIGGVRDGSGLSRGNQGLDGLFYIANETGGELFERFNDLGEAMGRMLERTSVTYLLSFEPKNILADGSYHPIKVKLKRGPSGARLLHRPGYFSPKAFEYRNSIEKSISLADRVLGGEQGGEIQAEITTIALPGTGGKAQVPIVVEISGKSLLEFHLGKLLNAEIYVYAMDSEGGVAGFLSQMIGLNLLKHRQTLEEKGLKFFGDLELAPGDYQFRVLVRNNQASTFGVFNSRLSVPDFQDGKPSLEKAILLEAPGDWILVREEGSGSYPFQIGETMLLPTSRVNANGLDRLVFWWNAYNLSGGEITIDGRLTSSSDSAPPKLLWIEREPGDGSAHFVAEVDASQLIQGRYGLELDLIDGSQEVSSRSSFEVLD